MPALDHCHLQVVRALEKEGWDVHPLPYVIRLSRTQRVYIDIQANKPNYMPSLVVEVKCFAETSANSTELYTALGQYLVYRSLLAEQQISADLFLAVHKHAYDGVIKQLANRAIIDNQVKMIIVDLENEVIQQWLS